MKIRFRYHSRLARLLGVQGIVLYPFVFLADSFEPAPEQAPKQAAGRTLRHELVHVRQIRELGWLRFYSRYLREYFTARLRGKSHFEAYRTISFEQEAYALQDTADGAALAAQGGEFQRGGATYGEMSPGRSHRR